MLFASRLGPLCLSARSCPAVLPLTLYLDVAAAAPSARDFVVEDLKDKLRAAAVRERELHQHLLYHMEGLSRVPSLSILLLW